MNGIINESFYDFTAGLAKLTSAYSTSTSMLSDLYDFIDFQEWDETSKVSVKKTVDDMKSLIKAEIEKKTYQLLREFEDFLRSRQFSVDEYQYQINHIYSSNVFDIDNDIDLLLGACGRIYSEISSLNQSIGCGDKDIYDHYLAYCIAGWIIDNVRFSCILGKTQKQLAGEITDQIFEYLRNTGNA